MLNDSNIIEDLPDVGKGSEPPGEWKKYPAEVSKIGRKLFLLND